jgi:hypothetical protein
MLLGLMLCVCWSYAMKNELIEELQESMKKLQAVTLEDASAEISKLVYESTRLIECLEFCKANDGGKRIRGNGHHLRQEIAEFAVKLLKEQWEE